MIILNNVSKSFDLGFGKAPKTIFQNLNLQIPTGLNLGLLGRNGAGKSTLLQLIDGSMAPTSGQISRQCQISWRLGLASSFNGTLTGRQNISFVARIYGVDETALTEFVAYFSELGPALDERFRGYSSGMRQRLAFGISMGIEFDIYLIDETLAVGDRSFKQKCRAVLADRLSRASIIMVSHAVGELRKMCDSGLVLENGRITFYEDIEDAIAAHGENLARQPRHGQAKGANGRASIGANP